MTRSLFGKDGGSFDNEYPLELVKKASKVQVNAVHNQALKAASFNRLSVPRKIFLMIAGGENE